jgi:hypothetical protein
MRSATPCAAGGGFAREAAKLTLAGARGYNIHAWQGIRRGLGPEAVGHKDTVKLHLESIEINIIRDI